VGSPWSIQKRGPEATEASLISPGSSPHTWQCWRQSETSQGRPLLPGCSTLSAKRSRWLTHVILATWEAEIRKTVVQGQPGAKSSQDSISTEKRWACCSHLSSQATCKAETCRISVPCQKPQQLGVVACICHLRDGRKCKNRRTAILAKSKSLFPNRQKELKAGFKL
jgi:hypothetical protein